MWPQRQDSGHSGGSSDMELWFVRILMRSRSSDPQDPRRDLGIGAL
jgi:hypothetical protein